ncbi:MAG: PKD domain-containing protein [Acidobacteriota bacterium]
MGTHRVLEVVDGSLLLEGAADHAAAVSVQGIYRFDRVEIRRARLEATDPIEVEDLFLDGDALLRTDVEATSLEIASGTLVRAEGTLTAGSMVLGDGAMLKPSGRSDLIVDVAGSLTVGDGAVIDTDAFGYGPGPDENNLRGKAPDSVQGSMFGGSHGGFGFDGADIGDIFGSVYYPAEKGGGGGSVTSPLSFSEVAGGDGGGIIHIKAGDLVLHGTLRANGRARDNGFLGLSEHGGAGGTVTVEAATLSGPGTIVAEGSWGERSAGGGGRVALRIGTFQGFDVASQVSAAGGVDSGPGPDNGGYGGAGTIFIATGQSTYGDLLVDAGGALGDRVGDTPLPHFGTHTVGAIESVGSDLWVTPQDSAARFDLGVVGMWARINGSDYRVAAQDPDRTRVLLEGAASAISSGDTVVGVYKFDRVTVTGAGRLIVGDVFEVAEVITEDGGTLDASAVTIDQFEVPAGSVVEVTEAIHAREIRVRGTLRTDATRGSLVLDAETLVVEPGGRIDQSGRGFLGGPGPEGDNLRGLTPAGVEGSRTGASHGGFGHLGDDHGEAYGSVYRPRFSGAGGGSFRKTSNTHTFRGGTGGGVVEIRADDMIVDGEIVANGVAGEEGDYGGAGGSLYLDVGRLSGSGELQALGADANKGAGAGGRIAIKVNELLGFDPATLVNAAGGVDTDQQSGGYGDGGRAGAGTIFLYTSASTYGELRVDARESGALTPDRTVLPSLGQHTIGMVEIDAGDPTHLWIEPQAPEGRFDLGVEGAWARVEGVDYRVLEESGDRRRVLLEGAAGSVQTGDGVRGVYKFDRLTLAGTAGVDAVDLIEAAVVVAAEDADLRAAWTDFVDLTVEPMATFVAQDPLTVENLTVRAGGALRSVEGRTLRLDVGHLDVESGAEVSASGLGFGGGGVNTVAGHAPDGVPGSLEAGSHGGLGRWADASSQTYGSIKRPRFAGGGGGEHGVGGCTGCPPLVGGSGGGVIEITAQTAHIDGAIRANGVPGQDNKRGGAGGTVFMEVGTLDGAGTIEARGGDGSTSGGGGGRVALITGSTTFDPASQTLVDSVSNGGAGTVYVRTAASTWGDLYVNGGASGQTLALTRLPSLGEHEIAATVVDTNDPSDLWIEVLEGKGDPSLGVEGQIAMVQGVGFEVLDQVDRRLILLDGASGFVEAGMLVEGLHVFDNIYVSGSADFTSLDAVDAAAWHVDPSLTPEWDPLGPGLENCGSGNLLTNPSAEMTTAGLPFDGWQVVSGPWEDSVGSGQHFGPADGTRFFWPGIGPSSVAATYELRQDVDLSGHGAAIDGGRAQAFVAATLIGLYGDGARLRVDYLDAAENVLESYTPPVHYEDRWLRVTDTRALPVATRTARVRLIAEKTWSGGQDVSTGFDALRLHVLPTPVVEVTGPGSLLETEVTADFSVALLCPRPYAVSASFATADLSAVAGSDFTAQSGALLFAAGETAKTVSVTLLDDAATEGPETFRLDVTSPDLVVATPSTVVTVLDDELGGLSLTLEDSHPSDGVYPGAEVVYTATLDHGGPALANARMTSVSSPELSVVPGSVVTSVGTVVSEQPLDIDLGSLASPSTVTVTFTAVLDVFPGGGSVNSHLLLTADGIEDVPSDDPATPAAVDDATETPVATVPTGFELTAGSRLEGSALELDVNFYDSSANESYTATLDWGDGSAVEVPSVAVTAAGGSFSASHVFVQDGTYPGQICITDASGHETCESHDFVVENVAPRPGWLDLPDWSVDDFRGTASNWGQDRFINVGQTADSGPTALLSPFPALGARVSGQWRAWADLGFMGFVLGYEPGESESSSADYLIAVWKRGNEGTARRGVRLYRVQGRVASFWDLDGSPQSTLLAEATTLADVGYEYETDYGFEVELLPGRFRLWIDDQLEIDVTDDFSSLGGSFGLYNLRHHSNLFKRVRVQAADTTLSGGVPLAPFPSRYDFRDFTKEESIEGTNPTATWNTQLAGRKVHQNTESRPSFLYSDEALGFRRVRGVMRINGDDGYIGLALGYNPGDVTSPDADYVLVVWKRNTTGAAAKGLRAYHVQGIPANYWTFDSQPLLTKLADSTNYGAVGFEYQKNYRFEAHLEPDRFRLWVNEELEIDVAGTFSDGRFSLFNNAMRQAIYNDWFIDGLAVDEGQATPEAYVGFTDPGLLDSHGSATVELDGQLSAATHGSSSGVVSVQVAGQTFDDDLLLDGDACVWDELDAGCGAVPIRVLNVAPSVTVPGVIASGPSTFELDGATFTDPGHLDIHTAEVDWGDGSAPASATVTFAGGAGTVDANHDYSANGTYTVTTCVTDDDGGEGCTSVTITVSGLSSGLVPTVKVNAPESAPGSSPEADAAAGVDLAAPNAGAAPGAQFSWVDPSEEE